MERRRALLVGALFAGVALFCPFPVQALTTLYQYNASDYYLPTGTVASGTLGDTNVSDGVTFGIQEDVVYNQISALATNGEFTAGDSTNWTYLEDDQKNSLADNIVATGGDVEAGQYYLYWRAKKDTAHGNLSNAGGFWGGGTPDVAVLNFSFYKYNIANTPLANDMRILLVKPDGTEAIIWQNLTIFSTTAWQKVNMDVEKGNFTQAGTYQLRLYVYFDAPNTNPIPEFEDHWDRIGLNLSSSNYSVQIWHNSTPTDNAIGSLQAINASVRFNATYAGNYTLYIYDWQNTQWGYCSNSIVTKSAFTTLNCSLTSNLGDYRDPIDKSIRIALNETNHLTREFLYEDYIQYWVEALDKPPYYDFQAGNLGVDNSTPMPNQSITFYSLWYDDGALNEYFLEHNGTGVFQNEPVLSFSSSNDSWGNYTLWVPNASEGTEFDAKIWADDSMGQLNFTANFTISVQNVVPAVGNTSTNVTTAAADSKICVNASATDIGVGINVTWMQITYPNSTVGNITLSDTGCNAGVANDGRYGEWVNVGGVKGNLTLNTTFANDSVGNLNWEKPIPNIIVQIQLAPNPVGGSNLYVGFYGKTDASVVNVSNATQKLYNTSIMNGTLFVAKEGAVISWSNLRIADISSDMPNMDADLNLTDEDDKLETYFNVTADVCGLAGAYYLNTTDGNWKVGVIYSDEDSSNTYTEGDNIIFCVDFNVNQLNFEGGLSDYEIVFPRTHGNDVDMYMEAK